MHTRKHASAVPCASNPARRSGPYEIVSAIGADGSTVATFAPLYAAGVRKQGQKRDIPPFERDGCLLRPHVSAILLEQNGGPPADRTRDTLIKSQVLYH